MLSSKNIIIISIFSLFLLSPINTGAQIPSSVPTRTPGSSGCTGFETTPQCRPEWEKALEKCITGTFDSAASTCEVIINNAAETIAVCSPTNTTGPCRPERVNPYAADTIARQAQIMGQQVGYNMTCSASQANFWGIDTNTGLDYFMNSLCTIQGYNDEFSAEILVNGFPSSWQTLASDLKSIQAAIACGGIQYVLFNTDGTYRCLPKPTTPTTPTTPTFPTTPSTGAITGFPATLLNLLSELTKTLQNQLYSIGNTGTTPSTQTTTNNFSASTMNVLSEITKNLQNQLYSIGNTGTTPSTQTTTNNFAVSTMNLIGNTTNALQNQLGISGNTNQTHDPFIEISLNNNAKSGIYSVGETIFYYVTMRNINAVNSYYRAIPGDSCPNSSNSGQQVPWIVRTLADTSAFNDVAQPCQSGSNYIITVVGTNTTTGKTAASSISVLIR